MPSSKDADRSVFILRRETQCGRCQCDLCSGDFICLTGGEAIAQQFPGCPEEDTQEIAGHACQQYSGRVGRSAAAKQFDPTTVRLAVIAHMGRIEDILDRWERGK